MPEIKITERDLTTGYIEEEDYVVFVPGNVSNEAPDKKQYEYIGKNTLFEDLKTFRNAIGDETPTYPDGDIFVKESVSYDPGYLYARFLLGLGYKIYYSVPEGELQENINFSSTTISEEENYSVSYSVTEEKFNELIGAGEPTYIDSEPNTQIYTNVEAYQTLRYTGNQTFKSSDGGQDISYSNATQEQKTAWWTNGSFEVTVDEDTFTYTQLIVDRRVITKDLKGNTTKVQTYAGMVNAVNNEDFYEDLDDKSLYQFRFLTTGGYSVADDGETTPAPTAISQIINIANSRGDCLAIVDHARDLTTKDEILVAAQKCASKRATMFSPWCKYNINNVELPIPASMAYLEAFINGIKDNPTWYATAGRLRGNITGSPIKLYGEKFANSLMSDTGVSVNPITNVYPYGILIWGNRTLNNNSGLVASSFLNIRQLCIDIFKLLYINAKGYMFEQNSDRLWFNFKSNIVDLLENMQTNEGIRGYTIIRQDGGRAKVKAIIRVVPIEAVEKFDLTVELADSIGVNESN